MANPSYLYRGYRPIQQSAGPLGYNTSQAAPQPTAPQGPEGTPAYADYFKYANVVGPTIGGKQYGSTMGTPLEDMDNGAYSYNYVEPKDTPDRYKGLLTYTKAQE